jgi:hypothetical protein
VPAGYHRRYGRGKEGELLLDLKRRGLSMGPDLAVADGALGFSQAIEEVWPKSAASDAGYTKPPTCSTSCRASNRKPSGRSSRPKKISASCLKDLRGEESLLHRPGFLAHLRYDEPKILPPSTRPKFKQIGAPVEIGKE